MHSPEVDSVGFARVWDSTNFLISLAKAVTNLRMGGALSSTKSTSQCNWTVSEDPTVRRLFIGHQGAQLRYIETEVLQYCSIN